MTNSSKSPQAGHRKCLDYGTGREALLNAAVRAVAHQAGVTYGLLVTACTEPLPTSRWRVVKDEDGLHDVGDAVGAAAAF
ncbi:hypothetical protein ACFRCH_43960, partial [Streptomyces sp. NPDC056663]